MAWKYYLVVTGWYGSDFPPNTQPRFLHGLRRSSLRTKIHDIDNEFTLIDRAYC